MWLTLARGIAAVALGVVVVATRKTNPAIVNTIAIYWIVGSAVTLRRSADRDPGRRRLRRVAGIIGLAAGLLVLLRAVLTEALPLQTVRTALGITAIVTGLIRVSGGFHDVGRDALPHRVLLGSVEVALGIALVSRLPRSAVAIVVAVWGFAGGFVLVRDAIAMRRAARAGAESNEGPPAAPSSPGPTEAVDNENGVTS